MVVSDSNLAGQLALLGNMRTAPGPAPDLAAGGGKITVASGSLRLFSEGVIGVLPDGRRFFAM
jgi:hypothetical protein